MNPYQPSKVDHSKRSSSFEFSFVFRIHWFVAGAIVGVIAGFGHPLAMFSDARTDPTGCFLFFGTWAVIAIPFSLVRIPTRRQTSGATLDRAIRVSSGLVFGYAAVWSLNNVSFANLGSVFSLIACLLLAVSASTIIETVGILVFRSFAQAYSPKLMEIDKPKDAPESAN